MGTRNYDPNQGRFTNRDTEFGSWDNPNTINQYAYAADSPLQYADPTGMYIDCGESCNATERHQALVYSGQAIRATYASLPAYKPSPPLAIIPHFQRANPAMNLHRGGTQCGADCTLHYALYGGMITDGATRLGEKNPLYYYYGLNPNSYRLNGLSPVQTPAANGGLLGSLVRGAGPAAKRGAIFGAGADIVGQLAGGCPDCSTSTRVKNIARAGGEGAVASTSGYIVAGACNALLDVESFGVASVGCSTGGYVAGAWAGPKIVSGVEGVAGWVSGL